MHGSSPKFLEAALSRPKVTVIVVAGLVGLIWMTAFGIEPSRANVDLFQTYLAGDLYRSGHAESVYQPAFFADRETRTPAWADGMRKLRIAPDNNGTYAYSTAYFLLSLPLTATLSLAQFSALFFWLNALSASLVGLLCVRLFGATGRLREAIAGLGVGVVAASVYAAWLGQNTLIVLALILGGFALLTRRSNLAGGTLLLLAFIAKPWTIVLLPVLFIYADWKLFFKLGLAYVATSLILPSLILPSVLITGYAATVGRMVSLSCVAFNNCSIRGLVHRLFWPDWVSDLNRWPTIYADRQVMNVELAAILVICVVVLAGIIRNLKRKSLVLAAALFASLVPLGICWTHYLVMSLPITAYAAFAPGQTRLVRALSWVSVASLFGTHLLIGSSQNADLVRDNPGLYDALFFAPLLVPLCLTVVLLFSQRLGVESARPSEA